MFRRNLILSIAIILGITSQVFAVQYPLDTPAFETPGGAFQTYFDNMYTTTQCNTLGQVVGGFTATGVPICQTPVASGLFFVGETSGDTIRFDGTNWIRNNLIYNNGTNIGIGTQTPTATFDVNGQIRIQGGSPGIGKLLMSDATGIASWYDPLPSLSGSFWAVGGNTFSAVQNLGTISNHVLPIITNNIERMRIDTAGNVGIGTATPGARLEVGGQIKITGGGIGSGRFLVSDATGLASWTDIVPATSFSISGSTLGDTLHYNGSDWVRTNNIFHTGANVGIGTVTPGAKLEVAGQLKITGGSPGTGMVLTSDATGLASWQLPTIAGINGGQTNYIARWLTNTTLGTGTIYDNGTQVGFGKTNPTRILDTAGDILVNNLSIGRGSGNFEENTVLGWNAFTNNTSGQYNTAIGQYALAANTTGFWNSAIGSATLSSNTIGSRNTAVGQNALNQNIDGELNTAVGERALQYNTSGQYNTAIGGTALNSNITGSENVAVGNGALEANTTAWANTAIGTQSLGSNITGNYNTAVGSAVLYSNISGNSNTAQGNWALYYNTTGGSNTAIGQQALRANTTGSNNVAMGVHSLEDNTTGGSNVSIGNEVLANIATGSYNTAIGINAANLLTSGDNNIAIGYDVNLPSSTGSNQLNIGNWIYGRNGKISLGTTSPTYMFDVQGSGSIIRAGSGFCLGMTASGCVYDWTDLNNVVKSSGTPDYIAKFDSGGLINNSQLYETGGKLYIGDIPGIIGGAATVGYVTIEANGSTNSANPFLTLSENGGQECRMWITGANKIGSNCTWSAGATGFGFLPNQVPRADSTGDSLTGGTIFNVGNNVGIGISSGLAANLHVSGSTLVTGDLTVQGKLITDNIVNRTVNNVSISGSILPDAAAPLMYRDIGSPALRWNNLYLSGQVTISGGSPGLGKILTSDANGLATWSTGFSGSITASGITGGTQGYITKFGTGGNGLMNSLLFETGSYVALGSTTPQSRFEVWTGALSLVHFRGVGNIGIGSASVRYQTSGTANVGLGNNSLRTLTTGYSNTAVGDSTLYNTTAGYFNSSFGAQALYSNSIGNWNVGIGTQALWTNLDGNYNVAIGGQALYSNSANDNSVAIGYQALRASLANNNIAIGYMAGSGITTGANNIIIGSSVAAVSNTASNQLNIGNWIYGANGNIGIGTSSNLTAKLVVDSGVNDVSGLRLSRIDNMSPVYTGSATGLGIDANGNVVPVSNGDVVVYDALGRNSAAPVPDPDIAGRRIRYDFNKYFQLPTKQSFVVSNGNGAGYNAPYFKEDGVSGLCSYNGAAGSSPYDCAIADPVTGLSASPNNSFTMTARGDSYGYQLALGARGDAPLFARSGRWYNGGTNYGSGLYLADGTTPTPWQKVLTVPANHIEYFYVNIGYNSQLQEITGGGNIGMGTSNPDMRLVLAYSGSAGSTEEMMRIQRGVQGTDANMVNAFGTPYLMIGGQEKRTNSIQTIGFGYTSAQSSQPAEIGLVTTNTAGNTLGDLIFATRNVTTNTAPTERMRIGSNGNIAIGTGNTSGVAKLKIDGQIQITGGGVSSGHVLVTDNTGLGYWRDVATLGVGGFNYNAASDYSSLNTIEVAYDRTDMIFQLADNATDDGDRFIFQQDQWSGDNDQRYPLVMNGRYAAFDARYSLNYNSSTNIYATGNLLSATAYMDYANRRFGIGTLTPSDTLHVNGTFRLVDGTQGAGKVLTSDANGVATWQTPSGGGGGSGNYTAVLTSAASRTSNVLGDLGLSSPSLPVGYYNFRFTAKFRTAATTTGLGIALAANGATVTNYAGRLQAQTSSNAHQVYSNGTIGSTTLTSTAVPASNTDYVAVFDGIFQVTSPGAVKIQYRSEVNGSNVTIQPGSNLSIEPL